MTGAIFVAVVLPLMNIFGSTLGGILLHRGAAGWLILSSSSMGMFVCSLGVFHPHLPNGVRLFFLLSHSAIAPLIPPSIFALAPVCAPSLRQLAATNGLIVSGGNIGIFFGPPTLAAVVSYFGNWSSSAYLLCACALICIGLSLGLRGIERRSHG